MSFGSPLDLAGSTISVATPEGVRAAAKAALDSGATHYTDNSGISELREAVAGRLARTREVNVAADGEVLITSGVQEALYVALQVLVARNAEVVLVGPAPRADVELVEALGGNARVASCGADLQLNADAVADLITERTGVVLIHLPSATGQVVSRQALEVLADAIRKHDAYAIAVESDDASTALSAGQVSLAAIEGMRERTVTVGSFDAAGLDVWRVAYLAAPHETMRAMKRLKEEVSICAPAVSQYAALAACESHESDAREQGEQLEERRAAVAAALESTSLRYVVPEAGCFAFIESPDGTDVPALLLEAAQAGIRVADGGLCGADGWLRLTLCYEPALLTRAVSELAQLIVRDPSETRS